MVALRTLQERVRKSAIQLDGEIKNWERKVSIYKLNMESIDLCVAGQLGFARHDCMDQKRGFNLSGDYTDENMDVLKRLWIQQIRKRRNADYARRQLKVKGKVS